MPARESALPKTLADDLRSRDDDDVAAVFHARPDLLHPIPSDMRALTTRAATSPSIARYLDTVDAVHHFALRIASEQTRVEPTTTQQIVEAVVAQVGDSSIEEYVKDVVGNLRAAAVLWGSDERTHVVTAVRDQVAAAPIPAWPAPSCSGTVLDNELAEQVASESAIRGAALVAAVEEILDLWSLEPGAVLRSGGLSSRSLDGLVERLGADRAFVALGIDLACSAGLVAQGPTDSDIGWMPTRAFDEWCQQSTPRRWATLARAWMHRSGVTGDRPLIENDHPFTTAWREHVLTVAAQTTRSCTPASMIDVIDFRWPRRRGSKRTEALVALWHEAESLGVLRDGFLSPAGKALAMRSNSSAIAAAIAPYLPADVPSVHIQADHTIVAPGPLEPTIARRLRALADVESRGHATVFRISNGSLSRALALDPDATAWMTFLTDITDKPVPQPIEYLVTDAARKPPSHRERLCAPDAPTPARRPQATASPARISKALDVLRDRGDRGEEMAVANAIDIPKMESAAVVASLRYAIDHHETVHLSHAESDGTTASLLVDPIRLGGGSLTTYDHHAEQVRTLAVSRITGVTAVRISA